MRKSSVRPIREVSVLLLRIRFAEDFYHCNYGHEHFAVPSPFARKVPSQCTTGIASFEPKVKAPQRSNSRSYLPCDYGVQKLCGDDSY